MQTYLNFPHMASAKANRGYVITSMTEALVAIAELTEGRDLSTISFCQATEDRAGLYQHFDQFEVSH